MTNPSPRKRATMSAVYCLLVPLGLVFWMGALYPRHLDLEDRPARNLLNIVLIVHVIGVIPCVVSWGIALVLAWVLPGLAYGLWLQRQMRGASRSRQVRLG